MSIQKIRLRRRLKMVVVAASTAYMLFGVTGYARSVTSATKNICRYHSLRHLLVLTEK